MEDKLAKVRAEIERLKKIVDDPILSDNDLIIGERNTYVRLLSFIDTLQEEPKSKFEQSIQEGDNIVYNEDLGCRVNLSQLKRVAKKEEHVSEDLEVASKEWLRPQLDKTYANYGEAKMMELTRFDGYAMLDAIEFGVKWQKSNLWKPADGDDLPIIDREVVALLGNGKVVFAHRPPEYWDGKNIITGKVTRNYPKTYDKGGWNIPNIKYWLDCSLPNMEED